MSAVGISDEPTSQLINTPQSKGVVTCLSCASLLSYLCILLFQYTDVQVA